MFYTWKSGAECLRKNGTKDLKEPKEDAWVTIPENDTTPAVLERLCAALHIPETSSPEEIIAKYNEVIELWKPEKFVNFPDRYFEAKKIYSQLQELHAEAEGILKVIAYPSSSRKEADISKLKQNESPLFAIVSYFIVVLLVVVVYLFFFGGPGSLGSQQYRGDLTSFIADSEVVGLRIMLLLKILVCLASLWVGMFIMRIRKKK